MQSRKYVAFTISIQLYDGILAFRFSLLCSFNSRNNNKLNSQYSAPAPAAAGAELQCKTDLKCIAYGYVFLKIMSHARHFSISILFNREFVVFHTRLSVLLMLLYY